VSKQVFLFLKDSTKVPIDITHKKDWKLNGRNPTMLYVMVDSNYLHQLLVLPMRFGWTGWNISGPQPKGRWRNIGKKMARCRLSNQKAKIVFDDFISCRWVFDRPKNILQVDYWPIKGGFQRRLLVALLWPKGPDLMKVALPASSVSGHARYHDLHRWCWMGLWLWEPPEA